MPSTYVTETLRDIARHVDARCLLADCAPEWTRSANVATYTAELFVLHRLRSQCAVAPDPSAADILVFPFPLALWQVSGWVGARSRPALLPTLTKLLVHLHAGNAERHVFLDTNDAVFAICLHPLCARAIVVHYGDDAWAGAITAVNRVRRDRHFPNSVVVPYRTNVPLRDAREPQNRTLLLFGAINSRRNPARRRIIEALRNASASVVVREMHDFRSLRTATAFMRRAAFCLAPAGDTPSLTQRFPAAILSGCVPVRVDPYVRSPSAAEELLPFHRQIDWTGRYASLALADVPRAEHILRRLAPARVVPSASFRARMKYDLGRDDDASQLALRELRLIVDALDAPGPVRAQDA